ncbi:MAG: 1-deoxy-D-xylulose-5-phosphate synthase [Armatimonadetes bacterium]|nr:1-deoxy-D-xylulose-5-phosphate synthase [Candidatus Hippobium faecium]
MSFLEKVKSPSDLKKLTLKEKYEYCREAREKITETVSETGGHLASNLGTVELSVALHSMFSSPQDKIIWDVSHQSYTHKLITGRLDRFDTLRKRGGLSGFTNKDESEHDLFTTGHSGNSLSLAMGLAKSRDLKGEKGYVVAVIGDASICNGMAFEALNNVCHLKTNIIIVLNDNEMSISKNVGALAKNFSALRVKYRFNRRERKIGKVLRYIPGGRVFARTCIGLYHGFIRLFQSVTGVFFQELGITYLGPYDGHKIEDIENALIGAKQSRTPIVVHLITKKGKGYEPAEKNPGKFHGVGRFSVSDGQTEKFKGNKSFTSAFSETICDIGSKNEKAVCITAAMPEGVGLSAFEEMFPDRFFDVGMSEEHAVGFAAGLAKGGLKPFVCVYSTFLQRAYDQISHDVCLQNLPVTFMIDRSGLVGADGPTHHGAFDISYLSNLPNITIISPKNGNDLESAVRLSLDIQGPVAIRYPRGESPEEFVFGNEKTEYGKGCVLCPMKSVGLKKLFMKTPSLVFMACGRMCYTALKVREMLKDRFNIEVWDARFIKPLDREYIEKTAKENYHIFTFEENVREGGFGSLVAGVLTDMGKGGLLKKSFALPHRYIEHGSLDELYDSAGISAEKTAEEILKLYR